MATEAFDHEIRRAIIATEVFDLSKCGDPSRVTIEYRRMWFMAKVMKPGPDHRNLSSIVNNTADILLGDSDTTASEREQRRSAYVESLCDAVAHESTFSFRHILGIVPCPGRVHRSLVRKPYTIGAVYHLLPGHGIPPTHNGLSITDEGLFCAAIAVGNFQTLGRLLPQFKSNPKIWSQLFGDAMMIAARKGDKETLALMVGSGECEGNPPDPRRSFLWPFINACRAGQRDIVEYLLCLSPSSRVGLYENYLIIGFESAAINGHTELLKALLLYIEPTRRKDALNESLRQACTFGRLSAVQLLLDSGADANSNSYRGGPLHVAARSGYIRVVQLLLDHNAAPDAQLHFGRPLFFAAKNGHVEVVQLLLEHGADINAKGDKLSVLRGAARNGETTMVKYLLQRGVDLTLINDGDRALQEAAERGHEDIVRLLVGQGVNVNGRGTSGDPPILRAMLYRQQHMVEVLAELGAERYIPRLSR